MSNNIKVVNIFSNIASILEILDENPFKIRAYKKAINSILELDTDLIEFHSRGTLTDINGVGKDLAKKVEEFLDTGEIEYYEKIKEKVPLEIINLLKIQGVGPKFLATVFKEYGIKNIDDFEESINSEDILRIKGIGKKKIDEIKNGLELYKKYINKINISLAYPIAVFLKNVIKEIKDAEDAEIIGSVRRMEEVVDIIDIIVKTSNKNFLKTFSKLPFIDEILKINQSFGKFKIENGIEVKVHTYTRDKYDFNVTYLTGSKSHINKLRNIAENNNLNLSDNGLFKNKKLIHIKSENDFYTKLGLDLIQPELRENKGEIESAANKNLPNLIELKDIKGDLHTHSTWSDGKSTIEEMVLAAKELGYEYIAITDHSPSSRIANGLKIERLLEKKKQVSRIDKKFDKIKVFMGTEVDILPDGSLDYPDEILDGLDFVVASVHSNFKLDLNSMTERLIRALENPHVHALGHPTGRLIGEREPYQVDIDKIIEVAKKNNKALEVNCSSLRLDLKDSHAKKAIEGGVKIIISTDAHHVEQLEQMFYGVGTARRGWVKKDDVLNSYTLNKFQKWLAEHS